MHSAAEYVAKNRGPRKSEPQPYVRFPETRDVIPPLLKEGIWMLMVKERGSAFRAIEGWVRSVLPATAHDSDGSKAEVTALFDDLVGYREKHGRDFQTKAPRGFAVNCQLQFG